MSEEGENEKRLHEIVRKIINAVGKDDFVYLVENGLLTEENFPTEKRREDYEPTDIFCSFCGRWDDDPSGKRLEKQHSEEPDGPLHAKTEVVCPACGTVEVIDLYEEP